MIYLDGIIKMKTMQRDRRTCLRTHPQFPLLIFPVIFLLLFLKFLFFIVNNFNGRNPLSLLTAVEYSRRTAYAAPGVCKRPHVTVDR